LWCSLCGVLAKFVCTMAKIRDPTKGFFKVGRLLVSPVKNTYATTYVFVLKKNRNYCVHSRFGALLVPFGPRSPQPCVCRQDELLCRTSPCLQNSAFQNTNVSWQTRILARVTFCTTRINLNRHLCAHHVVLLAHFRNHLLKMLQQTTSLKPAI
jgi:hypothetical protein